jgi:hypothetical protein
MNLLASAKRLAEARENMKSAATVLAQKMGLPVEAVNALTVTEKDPVVRQIFEIEAMTQLLELAAQKAVTSKKKEV